MQRCAGGARVGLRCCPALLSPSWVWVCLRARQQFRPRRVSPGMLSRCLATSQFAAVRGRHCLDKLMSNEQRSQDSKVWGVKGEARVVTHGNFSSYSYGNTLSNGSSTPAVLGASVPTGCPSPPAGPPALGGDPAALSPNGHCHTGGGGAWQGHLGWSSGFETLQSIFFSSLLLSYVRYCLSIDR